MEKKKFVVPHVYILLLALILLFSLLSYIIPSNVYDYHDVVVNPETGQTRSVVDPETYHAVDPTPVSLMQFLTAVPRGMQESAQIIFFIFIVGGAMAVLQETRAIEAGMGRMIKAMKNKTLLLIPIVMFLFSLCGSVFGMAEETIPFIPIFVSLMIAAGYDVHQPVHDSGCTGYRAAAVVVRYDIPYRDVHLHGAAYYDYSYVIRDQG